MVKNVSVEKKGSLYYNLMWLDKPVYVLFKSGLYGGGRMDAGPAHNRLDVAIVVLVRLCSSALCFFLF